MDDIALLKQFLAFAVAQRIVKSIEEAAAVVQTAQAIARIEAELNAKPADSVAKTE
jgi:hypothetical protein